MTKMLAEIHVTNSDGVMTYINSAQLITIVILSLVALVMVVTLLWLFGSQLRDTYKYWFPATKKSHRKEKSKIGYSNFNESDYRRSK